MIEDLCSKDIYKSEFFTKHLSTAFPKDNLEREVKKGLFFNSIRLKLQTFANVNESKPEKLQHSISALKVDEDLKKQIIKNPASQATLFRECEEPRLQTRFLEAIQRTEHWLKVDMRSQSYLHSIGK